MDNLNCKTQAEEKRHLLKYVCSFAVKGASIKDHIGGVRGRIKLLVQYQVKH